MHEGPAWLEAMLRALPEAGVRVSTLRGALETGHGGPPVTLPASSWGSCKEWWVWDGLSGHLDARVLQTETHPRWD